MTVSQRVLFVCGLNSIRSPIAAALLDRHQPEWRIRSCGVWIKPLDIFAQQVMQEVGIDIANHRSLLLESLSPEQFDWMITLSEDARAHATPWLKRVPMRMRPRTAHWTIADPSDKFGNRETVIRAYRNARDDIQDAITAWRHRHHYSRER